MISILTSTFNSSVHIESFLEKFSKQAKDLAESFEFIVVDDGSSDNTLEVLKNSCKRFQNLKIIELSRNYGQMAAIFCGLGYCKGDFVFVTDSDIEEYEDNLVRFFNEYKKDTTYDMIYGVISEKKNFSFISSIFSNVFNNFIYFLTNRAIPKNQSWTRLIKKNVVLELLKFREIESYPAGIFSSVGFKQKQLHIKKNYKGFTSYSFFKKMKLALNIVISFSSFPLVLICLLGFVISFCSFLLILYIFYTKFFYGYFSGLAFVVIFLGLVGGLSILSLGVVGLYVSKIFNQVKNRPNYIIRNVFNFNKN